MSAVFRAVRLGAVFASLSNAASLLAMVVDDLGELGMREDAASLDVVVKSLDRMVERVGVVYSAEARRGSS